MFLRNKIAILSVTLMSLMTIPTLAENNNAPVTSRIQDDHFDVEIKTPEGWTETREFTEIPENLAVEGHLYKGIQFKNRLEHSGCAIFFTGAISDNKDEDKKTSDALRDDLAKTHELAFPGSTLSTVTVSALAFDSFRLIDFEKKIERAAIEGIIEADVSNEQGDKTSVTISGALMTDFTKDNFAIGSGTFLGKGSMPITGTTAILTPGDFEVVIVIWGSEEETQFRDVHRFVEAIIVKQKAPATGDKEPVAEKGAETVVSTQPDAEKTSNAVVTESVAAETVQEKPAPSAEVSV
ncbi:MAG TPA: hypothetical protein VFU89_03470 [Rhabdochlamydiaceae bacterium]|nr:hypothetical protein [Rhabdochlamydiaceae bacterium]